MSTPSQGSAPASGALATAPVANFFSTPDRIERLRREAWSWLNTPFKDGIGARARKGVACDCVSWIAASLQSCGAIGAVPWPKTYVSVGDEGMWAVLNSVLAAIPGLALVCENPGPILPAFMPGDILCGTRGKRGHHLALNLGDNVILHSWAGAVRDGNIHDSELMRHLRSVWRPVERPELNTQPSTLNTQE